MAEWVDLKGSFKSNLDYNDITTMSVTFPRGELVADYGQPRDTHTLQYFDGVNFHINSDKSTIWFN